MPSVDGWADLDIFLDDLLRMMSELQKRVADLEKKAKGK